jgi:hypothetical protein
MVTILLHSCLKEPLNDMELCAHWCSIYTQTYEIIKFPNKKVTICHQTNWQLLLLIHKILEDGFPSIKLLKQTARKANHLPETATSSKSLSVAYHNQALKFTPKDIQSLLSLLMLRYPSYVLPTVSEICKRDVFLPSPVLLQSVRKQMAYPVTSVQPFISEEEEHPPFIKDMLKLVRDHLYIPLENVQLEAVINGRQYQSEVYHPLLSQAEQLYVSVFSANV